MEGRQRKGESEADRPEGKHETGMEEVREGQGGRGRQRPWEDAEAQTASRRLRQGCMQPPSWRNTWHLSGLRAGRGLEAG